MYQLRYQEACGYGQEVFPEAEEGGLSLTMNGIYPNPDIGGANLGGQYLVVSSFYKTRVAKMNTICKKVSKRHRGNFDIARFCEDSQTHIRHTDQKTNYKVSEL